MSAESGREPEALFTQLVARLSADPAVTPPSAGKGGRFGASGLKADGKLFAMVSQLAEEARDFVAATASGSRRG